MKKASHFADYSPGYPLHYDEFSHLDAKTKKKLLRLIARISEHSYRRGFQHGGLDSRTIDPSHFRNGGISLDKSPYTDVVGKSGKWVCSYHKSIDRLKMEYGVLSNLGFNFNDCR